MTKAARRVLADCNYALDRHSEDLQGEAFRISWVSIIVLLRAVGHVLEKVDAKSNPRLAPVIASEWKKLKSTKPKPAIFWEFIEQERNSVIKLYEMRVDRGVRFVAPRKGGGKVIVKIDLAKSSGQTLVSSPTLQRFSFIQSGTFAGRPEEEVAREAIGWWKKYLDNIDKLSSK
jgi:hypothetical protein